MITKNGIKELRQLPTLSGLRARHIPYECSDNGWEKNPAHEEEVLLLEYFNTYELVGGTTVHKEGMLFIRRDSTVGKDRLDAFTIIK